jgi:hypothetical protein
MSQAQVNDRIAVEKHIARAIVKAGIAAGYKLAVENGGDDLECRPTNLASEVLKVMFATDQDEIRFFTQGEQNAGWVRLIYGNEGYDVISDYTINLEKVIKPANDIADLVCDKGVFEYMQHGRNIENQDQ